MSSHQLRLLIDVMQSESKMGFDLFNNVPSSRWGLPDFAAQRLCRTAQRFSAGLCETRNPPWKWRPRRFVRLLACYSNCAPNIGAAREALRSRPRPRFLAGGVLEYWSIGILRLLRIAPAQRVGGAFRAPFIPPDPGLKPWAVLYRRFTAKSDTSDLAKWSPCRLFSSILM